MKAYLVKIKHDGIWKGPISCDEEMSTPWLDWGLGGKAFHTLEAASRVAEICMLDRLMGPGDPLFCYGVEIIEVDVGHEEEIFPEDLDKKILSKWPEPNMTYRGKIMRRYGSVEIDRLLVHEIIDESESSDPHHRPGK